MQDLIYKDVHCDLSAYRLRHEGVWLVIVVGEQPPGSLHVAIEAQLTHGTLVSLEMDIVQRLMERRGQAIQLGPWVEGHYDISGKGEPGD